VTTFYIDPINGNDANDGLSWPTAWKTITYGATSGRVSAVGGHQIRIAKSADPILGPGGDCLWTDRAGVTLGAAQTLLVDDCETAWTAAGGATVIRDNAYFAWKSGSYGGKITAPAVPAVSTLYAYFALPGGPINFSAYQGLTFWFRPEVAFANDVWRLCLCSNADGTGVVDEFIIPQLWRAQWITQAILKNGGGNLGNAIRSVALYSGTVAPTGSKYVRLDNINAFLSGGLNLRTLISKESTPAGDTHPWWSIQSINGTAVKIDSQIDGRPTVATENMGYAGVTESVPTYYREPHPYWALPSATSGQELIQQSGVMASPLEFCGGWNTGTNLQDGDSWYDSCQSYNIFYTNDKRWLRFDRLHGGRCTNSVLYIANSSMGIAVGTMKGAAISGGTIAGQACYNPWPQYQIEKIVQAGGMYGPGGFYGFSIRIADATILSMTGRAFAVQHSGTIIFDQLYVDNCVGWGWGVCYADSGGRIYSRNYQGQQVGLFGYTNNISPAYFAGRWYSWNHGGVNGDNRIITQYGVIKSVADVRHTSSGYAWKFSPASADWSADWPLGTPIARLACQAGQQVTASLWMRRDNAGITGSLVCRGGQIAGLDSDVVSSISGDTPPEWKQVSIAFTPTENGVVEIEAQAYGGTAYNLWIDDLGVQGAAQVGDILDWSYDGSPALGVLMPPVYVNVPSGEVAITLAAPALLELTLEAG